MNPEPEPEQQPAPDPANSDSPWDHLLAELAAIDTENRRHNRRVMEALKQIGTAIDAIASAPRAPEPARTAEPTRERLDLAEIHDRIARIAAAFAENPQPEPAPPPSTWVWPWQPARKPAETHPARQQRAALDILLAHVEGILLRAGLEKISAPIGLPFNPETMTAIEVIPTDEGPTRVATELAPGWRARACGPILRPAQVRVLSRPAPTPSPPTTTPNPAKENP